ncbi:hypothetical protein A9Q91_00055 [Candidatus Gracilibacteria bacterium 28_42_T64]|nr:hypothetical protein A9Q91_00055 [Candidatus Gracilibacteria bacterium 28_42_T64]
MTYNASVAGGPTISETTEQMNEKYENMPEGYTPEYTQNMYGNFKNDKPEINNNQELLEKGKSLQDSPHYPLLLGLEKSGQIDQSTFDSALLELGVAEKDEELEIIHSAVSFVKDPSTKQEILSHLEGKKEVVTEDTFEKTEFCSHAQNLDIGLDNGIGGLELLLANEYMSIPDLEGNTNNTSDMERTMDIVSKIIIQKNSPDFNKNNAELIAKVGDAKSISEKYAMLKSLYKQNLKTDAKLGGKKAGLEIAQKQKSLKKKATKISLHEAEGKMSDSKNFEEGTQLEKEKNTIIAEANELDIFEGEVFTVGELDKHDESLQQKNEQIA